jgi:hypothetical protein
VKIVRGGFGLVTNNGNTRSALAHSVESWIIFRDLSAINLPRQVGVGHIAVDAALLQPQQIFRGLEAAIGQYPLRRSPPFLVALCPSCALAPTLV